MKLVQSDPQRLSFHISKREKLILLNVLQLYPLLSTGYHRHRISQNADSEEFQAEQKLLDEALAEQRSENKKQLQAMLTEPDRFKEEVVGDETACLFTIQRSEIEWLLQVVNDIRVGSWVALGEPHPEKGKLPEITPENVRFFWAMEACGQFEAILIEALSDKSES